MHACLVLSLSASVRDFRVFYLEDLTAIHTVEFCTCGQDDRCFSIFVQCCNCMFACTPLFAYKVIREILFSLLILAFCDEPRLYGEDVGSEETRSIESEDLRKDDVSDLFDETEEIRRPKEPGQPGNPGDLSADTGSVPILNILGRSQVAGAQDAPITSR